MQLDIHELKGPVLVTVGYICLWYFLLCLQVKTKFRLIKKYKREKKKFDRYFGQDNEMLAADRSVSNTQEQMIPFLVSLWLCALFSSPVVATWSGTTYIGLRLFYPFLIGRKITRLISPKVFFVTFPSYLVIFYMLGRVVWKALS